MTDYPIIFSAPMVRALLEGRKTMTRRLAWRGTMPTPSFPEGTMRATSWQKVKPGDRLWVRENFAVIDGGTIRDGAGGAMDYVDTEIIYAADRKPYTKITPCIHMPRRLSRLTLIVTATKIEPLQSISERDAEAEGAPLAVAGVDSRRGPIRMHRTGFVGLWRSLHGDDAWAANPDVVALTFRVVKANVDAVEAKAA